MLMDISEERALTCRLYIMEVVVYVSRDYF